MGGQFGFAANQVGEERVDLAVTAEYRSQRPSSGKGLGSLLCAQHLAGRAVKGQHPGAHGLLADQPHVQLLAFVAALAPGKAAVGLEYSHWKADAHQPFPSRCTWFRKRASPIRQASFSEGRSAS